MSGSAYNVPTPLTVQQSGYPEIRFSAHYQTKPFGPYYPYYSWRASLWNDRHDQAWEFTQVHHRLFLANNPPEIQYFAIHFGYNFYMAGHAWQRHGFIVHVDGGVLICSPETPSEASNSRPAAPAFSIPAIRWRAEAAKSQSAVSSLSPDASSSLPTRHFSPGAVACRSSTARRPSPTSACTVRLASDSTSELAAEHAEIAEL